MAISQVIQAKSTSSGIGEIALWVFVAVLAALGGPSAWSQAAPTGLPANLLQEVLAPQSLPTGTYTLVNAWQAAGPALSHTIGRSVTDKDAVSGHAWEGRAFADKPSSHLIYGPYADKPPGDYVAFFRVKLMEDAGEEAVATIDAAVDYGQNVLTTRDLRGSDLLTGRYVEVPLAFHSPGGKLECRLVWTGYSSLLIDQVSLYRLENGKIAPPEARPPQPEPSGQPANLPFTPGTRPFPDIFPRAPSPSPNLVVADISREPPDWQLCLLTLQGLVNRSHPSVYVLFNGTDRFWLDWMLKNHWIKATTPVANPELLLQRFRDRFKGVIITDPFLPATKNIATMMAGVDDGVVVSPRMAARLHLPVLRDLRGRWHSNVEAYRWAFDNLWPRLNHFVVACSYPDHLGLRDYLVQNRVFIFWVSGPIDGARKYGDPTAEIRLAEQMLSKMPPNIPVMSYPWAGVDVGMGEGRGVGLFAEFAKYLVGSIDCTNLSVHSGIRVAPLRQHPAPPAPPLQQGKVYVSFVISDGDNLPVLTTGNFPQLWQEPVRGRFPIGWSISPSSSMLIPDIANYYYTTASPGDTFLAAVSGIGYTYPDLYGKRFSGDGKERAFHGFLAQTAEYMKRMDLSLIWPMNITGPALFRQYAEEIPFLQAIFPDYGRRVSDYDEADTITSRGVPVFHAITGWKENATHDEQVHRMVAEIQSMTPQERPAFLHLFIWNWGFNLQMLQEVLKELGPDYVDVRPDHLTTLYKASLAQKQIIVRAPTQVWGLEGWPIRISATASDVTNHDEPVKASIAGLTSFQVAPDHFSLRPGDTIGVSIRGAAAPGDVHLDLTGPFGARRTTMVLKTIPAAEVAAPLPAARPLQFVGHFEAEVLSHGSGSEVADAAAVGGRAWSVDRNNGTPGYVVFGPYKPADAGRYLALFRLKRTGPGEGVAATLDTSTNGGHTIMASRAVNAGDLPVGQYRYFALEFDHPGGLLETRVQWGGAVPLNIDTIDLWQIGP